MAMHAPPIAHAGHWATQLIYLAPIVIAVLFLWVQSLRDRRHDRRDDADASTKGPR